MLQLSYFEIAFSISSLFGQQRYQSQFLGMRYSAVHSLDSLSNQFGHTVVWLLPIIAHAQRGITFLSKNS